MPSPVYAVGFYPWKKRLLRSFRSNEKVIFRRTPQQLPREKALEIATWGVRFRDEEFPEGSRITRYEDGFIRSVGLGASFTPARSWIADRRGIYFDATRPSELEQMLEQGGFTPEVLARARSLRESIVSARLTKYNLGGEAWQRPPSAGRVILVVGQVESDASIRMGCRKIRTNIGLLQAVRREHPAAYVIYKPHPDVVAKVRSEGVGEADAAAYCNLVVTKVSMDVLIDQCDEVHVMTSLAGFEALLREKKVVTYGQPFYAGWGLTEDRDPPSRRSRRLELDALVAGCLIQYPSYLSAATGQVCSAEQAVNELILGIPGPPRSLLERLLGFLSRSHCWHRLCSRFIQD
jgi:capsular polysaccharide export protein